MNSSRQYANLFKIQKILQLVQVNGKKCAVIKWQNFQATTVQPVQELKLQSTELKNDLQAMQMQQILAEKRKRLFILKSIQLQKLFNIYYSQLQCTDYEEVFIQKLTKNDIQLIKNASQTQKIKATQMACTQFERRIQIGLQDLTGEDYFQLLKINNYLQQIVQNNKKQNIYSKAQSILQNITGIIRDGKSYIGCVVIVGKIYMCSLQQMIQYFPIHFLFFLNQFLNYMKTNLKEQVQRFQKYIKSHNMKSKVQHMGKQTLNVRDKLQQKRRPIKFGFKQQDLELNQKLKKQNIVVQQHDQNLNQNDKLVKQALQSQQNNKYAKDFKKFYKQIKQNLQKRERQQKDMNRTIKKQHLNYDSQYEADINSSMQFSKMSKSRQEEISSYQKSQSKEQKIKGKSHKIKVQKQIQPLYRVTRARTRNVQSGDSFKSQKQSQKRIKL